MKKRAVGLLLGALFVSIALGHTRQPEADTDESIQDWAFWEEEVAELTDMQVVMLVTYFYTNPRPQVLPELLTKLCDLSEEHEQEPVLEAFVASVAVAHPDHVEAWIAKFGELDPTTQRQMFIGLWLASSELETNPLKGLEASVKPDMLEEFRWYTEKEPQPRVPNVSNSPTMHDAMWAGFFAAGEPGYVKAIIEGLRSEDPLTHSMARWSLTSNAFQHQKVLDTCIAVRDETQDVDLKGMLTGIIEEANSQREQAKSPEPVWATDGE